LTVSLRAIFDSFKAHSRGPCFQGDGDGRIVQCGIAEVALRDLIDFHSIKSTADEALRAPIVAKLLSHKLYGGRTIEPTAKAINRAGSTTTLNRARPSQKIIVASARYRKKATSVPVAAAFPLHRASAGSAHA
jgi:hypothetical protein